MKSKRSESAARKFFAELNTGEAWDYASGPIKSLVWSAFFLYEREWDCHDHDIRQWAWPINTLREGGKFTGDEPWSILLRRAVELASMPAVA